MAERKTILLTGATGVVGSALLKQLGAHETICLVHSNPPVENAGTVEAVQGDVTQPRFGLDDAAYGELAQRVDTVVNCAASTDYTEKREAMFAINVGGVEHGLEFAADAGARYFHVSTAFTATPDVEVDDTAGSRDVKRYWNPVQYLETKRAADTVANESAVETATIKAPIVFGDSETGETANFQGLHVLMRAFFDEALPIIPLEPEHTIDFVPSDILARLMVEVIEGPFADKKTWWLTAGERALTLDDLMRIGIQYLERIGSDIPPPRVVPPDMVDRLIRPVFLPALPGRLQRRFEQLMQLGPLFFQNMKFESSLPEIEQRTGRPIDLKLEQAYVKAVDYWRDQQAAKKAEAARKKAEVAA